ncbi:MAG: YigZ family protein [Clostridia bacterium]|nr:YigZ family protein [Clostridia bacterium]
MHPFCERFRHRLQTDAEFAIIQSKICTEKYTPLEPTALKPFRTVASASETEYVVNRSRFIGRCFPVTDEAEALQILERIRKQHWDATHNCFAYRLKSGAARFSDDGEPQGTAGLPMMEVLSKRDVYDLLVVSTRYFGGILLGAGGLVRAYTRSASDAVEAAGLVSMEPCTTFRAVLPYPYRNAVFGVFERFGVIESTDYGADITCMFRCRSAESEAFLKALRDRTEGRITAEAVGEGYFGFPLNEQN